MQIQCHLFNQKRDLFRCAQHPSFVYTILDILCNLKLLHSPNIRYILQLGLNIQLLCCCICYLTTSNTTPYQIILFYFECSKSEQANLHPPIINQFPHGLETLRILTSILGRKLGQSDHVFYVPNLCSKVMELHFEYVCKGESFGIHFKRLPSFLHQLIPMPFAQCLAFQILHQKRFANIERLMLVVNSDGTMHKILMTNLCCNYNPEVVLHHKTFNTTVSSHFAILCPKCQKKNNHNGSEFLLDIILCTIY